MTQRGPATRKQEAHSTRDAILDAAERRFAERGFTGVSMREIAADAGLKNQASLYNHFRNKRALYEAALSRGVDPIIELVAASGQSGTGKHEPSGGQAADPFVDHLLDYLIAHPHLPRLIQRAALDDSRHFRHVITRLLRPLYAQGVQVLAASGGRWKSAELPYLAAGLYHLIFGYFANAGLLETVVQADPLHPQTVDRQRQFVRAAVAQLLAADPQAPRRE